MTSARCLHCGTTVPEERRASGFDELAARFCCRGCEAVHGLLLEQGLSRFYELGGGDGVPVSDAAPSAGRSWLEPLLERSRGRVGGSSDLCTLTLDVQGIHCAACVWLFNETFRRRSRTGSITVNPALGQVRVVWSPGALELESWIGDLERFGYRFGPARKTVAERGQSLALRLGVSVALTLNVMLFSVSFYFGLTPSEPEVFRLFTILSFLLSTGVVVIGGSPFFRGAFEGLRRGVLHLDLPIAAGITLVYLTSSLPVLRGRGDQAFFDTLDTFVCLMLVGRWLQERVLERNRRFLLDDDGADGILVRRLVGNRLEVVPAPMVHAGDVLLVAPGDLVPVDATAREAARLRTDWIHGESEPHFVAVGGEVPAGAFNAGQSAFHAEARTGFADSPLVQLLRQPTARRDDGRGSHLRWWGRLARVWVVAVVGLAVAGFFLWLPAGLDKASLVAASLLVVTCPCAIGLAIPLAYELALASLRRRGFFARSEDLLDRLTRVRTILFDKTGTLTLGRLEVAEPERLQALEPLARRLLYNLAVRSAHPVSSAVAGRLQGETYDETLQCVEVPGQGVECETPVGVWRFGRPSWAVEGWAGEPFHGATLSLDRQPVLRLATREEARPRAAVDLSVLRAEGYSLWLLSGDARDRVARFARAVGLPSQVALGDLSPEDKAAWVARLDRDDTLFLGDGVNDALAFARAFVAGTPAADRPVIPSRSDFFLVGEGLTPLREAFDTARRLRRVVSRLVALSVVYNVAAVAAGLAGRMTPLLAAVTMPASTLLLLAITVWSLRDGPRLGDWRAARGAAAARAPATWLEFEGGRA